MTICLRCDNYLHSLGKNYYIYYLQHKKYLKQAEAKMYETIQGHIKYSSNNKRADPASDCASENKFHSV